MIRLGLTGGMGCGKSTAARFFAEEGFGTIDADAVVHDLLAHDDAVRERIRERFGERIFRSDGAIDRRKLGAIVFADAQALAWLEALLHPLVGKRWREEIARSDRTLWVVQVPLLFEKRLEQSFEFTVCVGTSSTTQRRRLLERGLTGEEITQRLARQLPLADKTAKADFFLLNDGSTEFLREQVHCLCRQLDRARPACLT